MTLKSDAKFKEKLTCSFKYDMRNLVNFHPTTEKVQKFHFGLFLSKAYKISEELCVTTLKCVAEFKGKLTCSLKNDIRTLVNFYASSRKSENVHLDRILLSKAYKDLDEKVQNRYVS